MDSNDTIILTPAVRQTITDVLNDAIESGAHGDHQGYLATLAETPDGTDVMQTELADVIEYFQIMNA